MGESVTCVEQGPGSVKLVSTAKVLHAGGSQGQAIHHSEMDNSGPADTKVCEGRARLWQSLEGAGGVQAATPLSRSSRRHF